MLEHAKIIEEAVKTSLTLGVITMSFFITASTVKHLSHKYYRFLNEPQTLPRQFFKEENYSPNSTWTTVTSPTTSVP